MFFENWNNMKSSDRKILMFLKLCDNTTLPEENIIDILKEYV